MKKMILSAILTCMYVVTIAANIVFSGATGNLCPNVSYDYTAQAVNAFGSQKGCFVWNFYANGEKIWTYGSSLSCSCDNNSNSSTSEVSFTWNTVTTTGEIRILFYPRGLPDILCSSSEKIVRNINVRVVTPDQLSDGSGSIVFCSPNQTKTISITQAFNTGQFCYWNNSYDWLVPSGWSIVPSNPSTPYISFPWGINTKAHSVNLTAPSSVAPGFTGSYFVTVRTGPDWYWPPKEVTKPIWIGLYGTALTISGPSGVCPGNIYTYTATPPGGYFSPGHTYQWTKPSNWSIQSQVANQITFYVPQNSPSYGPVRISLNNGCGTTMNGITTYPGYNCGNYSFNVFPNPTTNSLNVELTEKTTKESEETNAQQTTTKLISTDEYAVQYSIDLFKDNGQKVLSQQSEEGRIKIDTEALPRGHYLLKIKFYDELTNKHILLEK